MHEIILELCDRQGMIRLESQLLIISKLLAREKRHARQIFDFTWHTPHCNHRFIYRLADPLGWLVKPAIIIVAAAAQTIARLRITAMYHILSIRPHLIL